MNKYKVGDILLTNMGEEDWDPVFKATIIVIQDETPIKFVYSYVNLVGFCNWTRYKNTFDSYIHCKLGEIT
jgi:hypothetical protein